MRMADQFTGQTLANKYRIDSFLRADDLGSVYCGTHVSMDKPVTVKILSPALAVDDNIVERFSAEARAVSRISHPNILNVTDFGSDKGTVYIVYEGAEGETLKDAIRSQGRFSVDRAVNITRQIAAALSVAHAAGEIHQNLSSENILLTATPDGAETVKVLGLGSVKSSDRFAIDEESDIHAADYIAPEQISDADTLDNRSDVYSLGVIFYEMLAGEVPFTGAKMTDVMFKHAQDAPPPLSAFRQDLPPEIEPLVLQAMAKNPEMRFQTAQEFAFALARVSQNYGEAETIVVARAAANEPANNIWKTAFVVLAGISLLAIGMIYATSVKQTNPTTQLQTDANGQPVQPINPATGIDEQSLSNLATMPAEIIGIGNSNMMMAQPPGTLPGGDNYNPWGGSGPPPGAPPTQYVAPGGQVYTIDPNNPSQFIPQDGNIILVPLPANTNVNANVKPSPTPRSSNTNANVAVPPPASNTAPKPTLETKPTPTPPAANKTPAKPPEPPKNSSPAAPEKRAQSGKLQDTL